MYELEKVAEKTYYIKNPTNVGIYKQNEKDIWLIDAGNDKDAGRKILKIVDEQGWNIKGIINTHSNADHIGGDKIIQDRTGCKIISTDTENSFTKNTILEASFLYGGYPFHDLTNKFLMAKSPEKVESLQQNLPEELEVISLPGHYFEMIGIKTPDNVYFLADSLFSEETIQKYHIFFIYDVAKFLDTLDYLETLEGDFFIPSHNEGVKDIKPLIKINRNKINEVMNSVLEITKEPNNFETILQKIFEKYELIMNANQYVLVGSTIKSYLSYLYDNEKLEISFENNQMLWKTK